MNTGTLSVLVERRPDVLARVSGLLSRRGFNIDSLAVGDAEEPSLARMTIACSSRTGKPLEQITKQLHRLINVIEVAELAPDWILRELALIKVGVGPERRHEVLEIVEIFGAEVVDVDPDSVIVSMTGPPERTAALQEQLRPFDITEMVRTGVAALRRGMQRGG